jgi:hypothetical protein
LVDSTPDKIQKLKQFVEKISVRRLINPWSDRESLKSKVIISLSKAFSDFPRVGWVRADAAANEEILSQVVSLRNEIDVLGAENARLKAQLIPIVSNLAPLTSTYKIRFRQYGGAPTPTGVDDRDLKFPWDQIFATVGPAFFKPASDANIARSIESLLAERFPVAEHFFVYASCVATIKIQLMALGFLEIYEAKIGGVVTEFMRLTDLGKRMLIEIMAVRAPVSLSPEQNSAV